jgi:hypothetical protein
MAKWVKKTYKLDQMYGWKAKPGYHIFVADRGAVRFDFPDTWVMQPAENGVIELRDRQPPDDDCLVELTVFHLRPDVDWTGLPMGQMLANATDGGLGHGDDAVLGPITEKHRGGLDLAWRETQWVDQDEKRDARARSLIAHKDDVQILITMSYWQDDVERFMAVWDELVRTLRLAEYVRKPDK